MDLEFMRCHPGGSFGQPRPDLLTNAGQQMKQPALKGRREELNSLKRCFGYGGRVFAAQRCMVCASRPDVRLAAHFGQR
jgi:hypothetical protein